MCGGATLAPARDGHADLPSLSCGHLIGAPRAPLRAENEGAPGRAASIDHRLSARELLPALVRDERLSARRSAIRGLVRPQLGRTPSPSVCRPHASICG